MAFERIFEVSENVVNIAHVVAAIVRSLLKLTRDIGAKGVRFGIQNKSLKTKILHPKFDNVVEWSKTMDLKSIPGNGA